MSDEDKFDAIIVGAGVAGSAAAYELAKAGKNVLLIERGNTAGSKNMTGGRLYAHSLEKLMPGFAEKAPVERRVTREKVSFMTADSAVTLDYSSAAPLPPEKASYTVLRAEFDAWLAAEAENAGAQCICGVRVDKLLVKDGKVCGVEADGDAIEANVVILADGVNSILGEQIGMVKRVAPGATAVGVKEIIELPAKTIEDRFGLNGGSEGAAWLFAGTPSDGLMGGGFLYTNKESVSLGVVVGLGHIDHAKKSVPQMLEDFKRHPAVAPLVKDGKTTEYSAHVVPEGGLGMIPEIVGDGVLIVGDAAGLCLNVGYTVRGMDLAIESGVLAARAVLAAEGKSDKASLSLYKKLLDESFVMRDLRLYKKLPDFLENNPRVFNDYPAFAANLMHDLFAIGGEPERPLRSKLIARAKEVGFMNLLKDAIKGGTAL